VALAAILDSDADAAYRQIAIVDANRDVATHTGELCISEGTPRRGRLLCAGEPMDRSTVWAGQFNDLAAQLDAAHEQGAAPSPDGARVA